VREGSGGSRWPWRREESAGKAAAGEAARVLVGRGGGREEGVGGGGGGWGDDEFVEWGKWVNETEGFGFAGVFGVSRIWIGWVGCGRPKGGRGLDTIDGQSWRGSRGSCAAVHGSVSRVTGLDGSG
jgi:hypothetical protein